ncbi:MAG: hypothetical protein ACTSPY_04870 [Candidatus Helarchaeota archaeon]
MDQIEYSQLENVINKIYSKNYRLHLLKKYQLVDIGKNFDCLNEYKPIEFYLRRFIVVGVNGKIFNDITTGPCLLPTSDINLLKNNKAEVEDILNKQPTIQNVLLTATATQGIIHVCLETKEFSNLLSEITKKNNNYIDKMIEIAQRTMKINKKLLNWWGIKNSNINLHYTHDSKVNETIIHYCKLHGENYIKYLLSHNPKSNNYRIGQKLQKLLINNIKIEDIDRIRIYVTYFPGWWGKESIKEHTIVENIFHDAQLFTKLYSKSTMVGLLPPKDLTFRKPEMDLGLPLYLGTEEKVREGIEILQKTKFPIKNRYNCIVGNLLLFGVKRIQDYHCIESCGRKKLECTQDCRKCLDILEEFLFEITK